MSNNIPVITQEEYEPKLLLNPKLAMALPYLAPILVSQFPEKMLRMTLWGKVAAISPEPDFIQDQRDNHGEKATAWT